MTNCFIYDVETLSTESTAIVLSIAILPFCFEKDKQTTFQEFLERTHFFKLSVEDQANRGRTKDKETLDWWLKQSGEAKVKSFYMSPDDQSPYEALNEIRKIIGDPKKAMLWQRGSLDQVVTESLCKSYCVPKIAEYYHWRDIRTALNCLGRDANDRRKIDGFIPHNPVHDVAKDALILVED